MATLHRNAMPNIIGNRAEVKLGRSFCGSAGANEGGGLWRQVLRNEFGGRSHAGEVDTLRIKNKRFDGGFKDFSADVATLAELTMRITRTDKGESSKANCRSR